jgi:RNA polymerase sigma-54 factor
MVEGETRVFCNHWDLPHLTLREDYLKLLRSTDDPELSHYLREKLQQAQWLLQCLDRRGNTLTQCLQAMVSHQPAFFRGDTVTVLPMTQASLAAQLGLHPSTVSRTIRNKYLQCQQGLFPLSHFFSRAVGSKEGLYSESMIKQEMLRLIREEAAGTSLSDQKISNLLKAKDIQISRRTVSKYRSQLGLSSSYSRRHTE